MSQGAFIPWAKPQFYGSEQKFVMDALESTWISGGPYVTAFEKAMADICQAKYALATSNGTTAIHLAFLALGLQAGDEVVVPAFAFQAAANIAMHMNIKPVFADVTADTWCLDAGDVEKRITPATKAIVAVHTYGNLCDMDSLRALTREKGLFLVEDAAEGFPSRYKNRYAGNLGDVGTFSFHATKPVTTGEGGMVMTDNEEVAGQAALFRSHGMARQDRFYWHELHGHNFRLTNLQAALGCAQLEHLATIINTRKQIYTAYKERLEEFEGLSFQQITPDTDTVFWAFGVKLDADIFPQGRDAVMKQIAEHNIETRPAFYPASALAYLNAPTFRNADEIGYSSLSLPSYPGLTEDELDHVCEALKACRR